MFLWFKKEKPKNKINKSVYDRNVYDRKIITFVTCWYIMKSKFPVEKYVSWIQNFLSIVNNFNLIIYTDITSYNTISNIPYIRNEKIKIIIKPIEDFYTYKYKEKWINNHNISNLDLHKHISWKLNMLWNEKIFFVLDAIKKNYFNTMYYGWCDIGYFRNSIDDLHSKYLSKWPNYLTLLNDNFRTFPIHYSCIQNNVLKYVSLMNDIKTHYKENKSTPPTNNILENCFAGGFFILQKEIAEIYSNIYDKKLNYYFDNNYIIKDDQTIIMDIIFTNPNLFYTHYEDNPNYNNWFMFQRLLL